MHLSPHIFVLGSVAACAAAVSGTVAAQSGANFVVGSPEARTHQVSTRQDGIYSEEGLVHIPQRKGMLKGRKGLLSSLGILVAVGSAAVLSFLLWNCFGKSERIQTKGRRLAAGSDDENKRDVCTLSGLSPSDLRDRAQEMAERGCKGLRSDQEKHKESEKKLEDAISTHASLQAALQKLAELPKDSSAETLGAAEARVKASKEALQTALLNLGVDVGEFSIGDFSGLQTVFAHLEKQKQQHETHGDSLRERQQAWDRVVDDAQKLESALAKLAASEASSDGAESEEVKQAKKEVDDAAFELETAVVVAVGLDGAGESKGESDSEEEEAEEGDEEEAVRDLPRLTDEVLTERATVSLADASQRLEEKEEELKKLEEKVETAKAAFAGLEEAMQGYREEGADDEQREKLRDLFQSSLRTFELALAEIPGQGPAKHYLVPPPPSSRGFVYDFCGPKLSKAGGEAEMSRSHHERRKRAWDRVRTGLEALKELLQKIAELESKESSADVTAQLMHLNLERAEAHLSLQKALALAQWEDSRPETQATLGYADGDDDDAYGVPTDGYVPGSEMLLSTSGDSSTSGEETKKDESGSS